MPDPRVALVIGASGVTGFPLAHHLLAGGAWKVYGVSRTPPRGAVDRGLAHVPVDLSDAAATRAALAPLADVTHVFYSGNDPRPDVRRAMLASVLAALEDAPGLANVHLTQGMKYYGVHLGRHRPLVRETDPRVEGGDFYYAEEDLLLERQRGRAWTWTALRPHSVCAFSPRNPVGLSAAVGIYASLVARASRVLPFPASAACFERAFQVADGELLARAAEWVSITPGCGNRAYNVSNGQCFTWRGVWPAIAAAFGLEPGEPGGPHLADYFEREADGWRELERAHGLVGFPYQRLPGWVRGDYTLPHSRFACEYDIAADLSRLRATGFSQSLDDARMFTDHFRTLVRERILPPTAARAA